MSICRCGLIFQSQHSLWGPECSRTWIKLKESKWQERSSFRSEQQSFLLLFGLILFYMRMFLVSFCRSIFPFVITKAKAKKKWIRKLDFFFKALQISTFMLLNQDKNNDHTQHFSNLFINKTTPQKKRGREKKSKIWRKLATGFLWAWVEWKKWAKIITHT